MKKKNILSLALTIILSFALLVGCTNGNTNVDSTVGSVGTEEIQYSEIENEVENIKKELIITRARELATNQFYKDIEVSDEEIQEQIDMYKEMYNEEVWDQFLAYNGFNNENEFKTVIEENLKESKKLESAKEEVSLTEEEILAEYDKDEKSYNHIVVNALSYSDEETYNAAKSNLANGKTFEDLVVEAVGILYEDEPITLDYEDFTTDISTAKVDDMLFTDGTNESYIIAVVKEVNFTFETNKDNVESYLLYVKAEEKLEEEKENFYKNLKVVIDNVEINGTELMADSVFENSEIFAIDISENN